MGMVELINAVLRCLPWGEVSSHTAQDIADHLAENDVVEVVRCKDCKHRYTASSGVIFCTQHITVSAEDNDFCSYGERREGK